MPVALTLAPRQAAALPLANVHQNKVGPCDLSVTQTRTDQCYKCKKYIMCGRRAMKSKLIIGVCVLACTAGLSFAADLEVDGFTPPRSPAAYKRAYDWTGLYFGANGGYGFAQGTSGTNFTNTTIFGTPGLLDRVTVSDAASLSGSLVGAQLGFNWQVGWFVFGGEIDGMWTIGHRATTNIVCGATCSAVEAMNLKGISTTRMRFGAAFDRVLLYATGGMAFVFASETLTMTSGANTATLVPFSQGKTGWTAGLGAEWAFWDHWSARLEYLYVDAKGSNNATSNNANTIAAFSSSLNATETAKYTEHVVRAGINYRFGP